MGEPLLSIILIAQKSTSFRLKRTLNSALKQSYEPKAVWVINANPSDNAFTLGLLEDLNPYPQVHVLSIAGQGTNFYYRNKALELVEGEFVAFMSDIDVWEPDKALHQLTQLRKHPQAGATFVNSLVLRETPHGVVGNAVFEHAVGDPQAWMLQKTVSYGSQVMYRAEALQAVGGFDEQLEIYGDLDVLVRMAEKREVLFLDKMPVKLHIPPLQDLRRKEYADNRYLLLKHADFFLLHKRTAFDFCLMLAKQAADNRHGLQMIVYLLRAVFKQPIRAVLLMVSASARYLGALLRRGILGLRILAAVQKLRAALRMGIEPRLPGPSQNKRGKKRKKPAVLDQLRDYEFVRFVEMTFMGNQTLEYVKVPDYVTVIAKGMFFDCKNLHTVDIPDTVTRIEANVFQGCERLKNVRFAYGSTLESIGAYAFAGCVSLAELELSGSLTALGKGAFAGCANLRSVAFSSLRGEEGAAATGFPSSLRTISRYAFAGCAALERVMFEPGSMLEKLETGAFYRCSRLETLKITGTVHTVAAYAFAGCTLLVYLDMQAIDSIRQIGRHAFENCKGLKNLYIPYAIKRIRAYTFCGCTSLKRVKIPQGVKRVGRRAFADCSMLENVTLMDETTSYRRSSFPRHTRITPYRPTESNQAERSVPD